MDHGEWLHHGVAIAIMNPFQFHFQNGRHRVIKCNIIRQACRMDLLITITGKPTTRRSLAFALCQSVVGLCIHTYLNTLSVSLTTPLAWLGPSVVGLVNTGLTLQVELST